MQTPAIVSGTLWGCCWFIKRKQRQYRELSSRRPLCSANADDVRQLFNPATHLPGQLQALGSVSWWTGCLHVTFAPRGVGVVLCLSRVSSARRGTVRSGWLQTAWHALMRSRDVSTWHSCMVPIPAGAAICVRVSVKGADVCVEGCSGTSWTM